MYEELYLVSSNFPTTTLHSSEKALQHGIAWILLWSSPLQMPHQTIEQRLRLCRLSIWAIIWKKSNIITPFLKCLDFPCLLPCTIGPLALSWGRQLVRRSRGWRGFLKLYWRRRAWRWRGRPSPLLKVSSSFTYPLIQERVRTLAWMVASLWCTVRRTGDVSPLRCYLRQVFLFLWILGASSFFVWGFSHVTWCINLAVWRNEIIGSHQRMHHRL